MVCNRIFFIDKLGWTGLSKTGPMAMSDHSARSRMAKTVLEPNASKQVIIDWTTIMPSIYSRSANIVGKMDVAYADANVSAAVSYFHGVMYILYAFPDGCSTGCKIWKIAITYGHPARCRTTVNQLLLRKIIRAVRLPLALIALICSALHQPFCRFSI